MKMLWKENIPAGIVCFLFMVLGAISYLSQWTYPILCLILTVIGGTVALATVLQYLQERKGEVEQNER